MSTDNEPTPTVANPPPKYSRYRSVRKNANTQPDPPPVVEVKAKDDGIARSMSRYRRSRATPTANGGIGSPSVPPIPQITRQVHSQSVTTSSKPANLEKEPARRATDPPSLSQAPRAGNGNFMRLKESENERARRKAREARAQEEENRRAAEKQAAIEAQQLREAENEAARKLEEQKKKDLERLEAELEAASPTIQQVSSPKEKFGFFSRKRVTTNTSIPPTPASPSEKKGPAVLVKPPVRNKDGSWAIGSPQPISLASSIDATISEEGLVPIRKLEPPKIEITNAIGQGGGGIVPQTDAPLSASNAGERRVLIRCKQSSINLPITPETTPIELIHSAANVMTQDISVTSSVLLESYTQLGLERRIRRYEHIRDILNSWDRDTQNSLIIEKSDSPQFDHDLEAASVSRKAPKDVTVYMYHSQKPGKWNKRYITLLAMGQIFISKRQDAKVTDKDVSNICHLSDFDIYRPTAQQLRKVLRPPKKHCYAIKSQQKTNMFLSTENFVHFFCTDDAELAEKWHDIVQQWRSWYLVKRMGEVEPAMGKTTKRLVSDGSNGKSKHTVNVSIDQSPYTIGSFQPLLQMERFGSPSNSNEPVDDSDDEDRPRQIPFHLRNSGIAPSPRESRRHPPVVNYKLPPEADPEFASNGLLGRTYTQRQRAQKEQEKASQEEGPFVRGPSLLNDRTSTGLGHSRSLSVKSTKRPDTSAGGLQRSGSQRQKPKPLLDFTPTFKEAPQWDKSKGGHGVKPIEGVPLVDIATGPEDRGIPGLPETLLRRVDTTKTRPTTGKREPEGAFIKGGLVSG